jgi:DNA-binding HxlR family transcriptional regulator
MKQIKPETWYQSKTRQSNKERIVTELKNGAKHFSQLEQATRLSHTTLDSILKELVKEGKAQKVIFQNREAYALTERGNVFYSKIWHLINVLEEIKINGGGYISTGKVTDWGLAYHQAISKVTKDQNPDFPELLPMPIPDSEKLEELLLPIIVREIAKYKLNLRNPKCRVIFALELDVENFGDFFSKVLHFMRLVKQDGDILRDKKLGFLETKSKAALFRKYLRYAHAFKDDEFEMHLQVYKKKLAREDIEV